MLSAGKSPLTGNPAFPEKWLAADVANPARIAARQIRDARQLGEPFPWPQDTVPVSCFRLQRVLHGYAAR